MLLITIKLTRDTKKFNVKNTNSELLKVNKKKKDC